MKPNMMNTMAYVDGRYYRVEPYPLDPWKEEILDHFPTELKKGIAYHYETDLTRGLFPYRGEIDDAFSPDTSPVGIYVQRWSHGRYRIRIRRPRTVEELKSFGVENAKNLLTAVLDGEYQPDQFTDSRLQASDIGKDAYLPPIRPDDDFLNKLIKLAIRKKAAPLEPYGKRMAALAVDKRRSVEGNNIKNNATRRHRENSAMSPSKAMQDADAWQLDLVVGVRNNPNAMHAIQGIPENGLIIMFPNSPPFDIKSMELVDAEDLISQAIIETSEGIESDKAQNTTEKQEPEE